MFYVIIIHLEFNSLFGMVAWGRLGMVSSAEGFVGLSGIVLGMVCRKRITKDGIFQACLKLWQRAFQLYKINLFVIFSIPVMGLLSLDIFNLTHWTDPGSNTSYSLYPAENTAWYEVIKQALLLKIGPHQFQIMGLYVIFLFCGPLVLYCLHRKQTFVLLLVSWSIYGVCQLIPYTYNLIGARFEFAFPLLNWQVIFINGMAVGYHRNIVLNYLASERCIRLVLIAAIVCLGFIFLSLNQPNPIFWPFKTFSFIDSETFKIYYFYLFQKNSLGFGRLVNNCCLFIVFYYLLSQYWHWFNHLLGWLFIPIGQASLYFFFIHIYFILIISNSSLNEINNLYVNTLLHAGSFMLAWLMIKKRLLFSVISR